MAKDTEAEKRKSLQKRFIEYQMLEQQIKQLQQQLEKLEAQTLEVSNVEQCIADMAKSKTGDEVLVPVSGGIFFKATVKESNMFLVNVGGNVVVEKSVDDTRGLILQQGKEIEKYKETVMMQLSKQLSELQDLEKELKGIIQE
jgi:prefoldin alpha subunit